RLALRAPVGRCPGLVVRSHDRNARVLHRDGDGVLRRQFHVLAAGRSLALADTGGHAAGRHLGLVSPRPVQAAADDSDRRRLATTCTLRTPSPAVGYSCPWRTTSRRSSRGGRRSWLSETRP